MSFSKSFSKIDIEEGEDSQKFHNFRLESPVRTPMGPNFLKEPNPFSTVGTFTNKRESIDSFFDKSLAPEKFNIFSALEEGEKGFWEKEKKEEGLFGFKMDQLKPSFKNPSQRKKGLSTNDKESETASNTKDTAFYGSKRPTEENSVETKCNTLSMMQKNVFNIEHNLFGDLILEDKNELPTLNSLVSLTIQEEAGSLNVNIYSNKMSENKLLNNFLNIADTADLNDLLQAIQDCEANLSAKLLKLDAEKAISF